MRCDVDALRRRHARATRGDGARARSLARKVAIAIASGGGWGVGGVLHACHDASMASERGGGRRERSAAAQRARMVHTPCLRGWWEKTTTGDRSVLSDRSSRNSEFLCVVESDRR